MPTGYRLQANGHLLGMRNYGHDIPIRDTGVSHRKQNSKKISPTQTAIRKIVLTDARSHMGTMTKLLGQRYCFNALRKMVSIPLQGLPNPHSQKKLAQSLSLHSATGNNQSINQPTNQPINQSRDSRLIQSGDRKTDHKHNLYKHTRRAYGT